MIYSCRRHVYSGWFHLPSNTRGLNKRVARVIFLGVVILVAVVAGVALHVPLTACESNGTSIRIEYDPIMIHVWPNPNNPVFSARVIAENVSDFPGLWGWEVLITWIPGSIECIGEKINVNIWAQYDGPWINDPIDNVTGQYHQTLTARAPSDPAHGSFWLANLTFRIIDPLSAPSGVLHLSATAGSTYCLRDVDSNEIPHEFVDGTYIITELADTNGDGRVDQRDAFILGAAFRPYGTYNFNADINRDGSCDAKDAIFIGAQFDSSRSSR